MDQEKVLLQSREDQVNMGKRGNKGMARHGRGQARIVGKRVGVVGQVRCGRRTGKCQSRETSPVEGARRQGGACRGAKRAQEQGEEQAGAQNRSGTGTQVGREQV